MSESTQNTSAHLPESTPPATSENNPSEERESLAGIHVVVEGAQVKCSQGVTPISALQVKHENSKKYKANEKSIATWLEDDIDHMNFNSCNNGSSPPPKCDPNIKWKKYYDKAEVGSLKVLTEESIGTCQTYGGTITIEDHGQKAQPSSEDFNYHRESNYTIFMINPSLNGNEEVVYPKVKKILPVYPEFIKNQYANSEAVEITLALKGDKGEVPKLILEVTEAEGDKNLISWAVYVGQSYENRIQTYLKKGSQLQLENFAKEGTYTLVAYGETVKEHSAKIILHIKKNKLEALLPSINKVAKLSPISFSPKYTVSYDAQLYLPQGIGGSGLGKRVWRIKQNQTILYSEGVEASSGISIIESSIDRLTLTFNNTADQTNQYILEYTDYDSIGSTEPQTQSLSLEVVNRIIDNIENKGLSKIRKTDAFHLIVSKVREGSFLEGEKGYWVVNKDQKRAYLGEAAVMNKSVQEVAALLGLDEVYGAYKFRADGNLRNEPPTIGTKGNDRALIEVVKNKLDSIKGPQKIPIGARVQYKAIPVIGPLISEEKVQWTAINTALASTEPSLSSSPSEFYLSFSNSGKIKLEAQLLGEDTEPDKVSLEVSSSQLLFKKALWCYANGKKRKKSGWEEENYAHISLEGVPAQTQAKINIWVMHPYIGDKERSLAKPECLLKEIPVSFDDQGSLQLSFIADQEIKSKLEALVEPTDIVNQKYTLFFTLEFVSSTGLDLSRVQLYLKSKPDDVLPFVEVKGSRQYWVLDADEDLIIPADPEVTAIQFSNEAADNIQIELTQYGKKHQIWVYTVGMAKEKLMVKVYRQLLSDSMLQTYNESEFKFQVAREVKTYPEEEVGADGLLSLDFVPEKNAESTSMPQLFFV